MIPKQALPVPLVSSSYRVAPGSPESLKLGACFQKGIFPRNPGELPISSSPWEEAEPVLRHAEELGRNKRSPVDRPDGGPKVDF